MERATLRAFRGPVASFGLACAALFALGGAVDAATVRGCVMNSCSFSKPRLNETEDAYMPFSGSIAAPHSGKSFAVQFLADDGSIGMFPLKERKHPAGPAASVILNIGEDPDLSCAWAGTTVTVPSVSSGASAECYWAIEESTGTLKNVVRIYYTGVLPEGESLAWRISGLGFDGVVSEPGDTPEPFDSQTPVNVVTGTALGTEITPTVGPPARDPARLILVFDRSGSMNWTSRPGEPGCDPFFSPSNPDCRRWAVLKSAADQMLSVVEHYFVAGDEIDYVYFNGTADAPEHTSLCGGGTPPAPFAITEGTRGTIVNSFRSFSPSGSTSLGAGVTALSCALEQDNADYNNMILAFTDGEQNVAPYLVATDTSILIDETEPLGLIGNPFPGGSNEWRTCVFWLRIDNPTMLGGTELNEDISTNGCTLFLNGQSPANNVASLSSETEMLTFFIGALHATFIGDRLEFTEIAAGTLSGAEEANHTITGSAEDVALTFTLGWDAGRDNPSGLRLEKDGVVFDPNSAERTSVTRGEDFITVTLRRPFCNGEGDCVEPEGEWTLSFGPESRAAENYRYSLIAMNDNRTLASAFRVGQAGAGVGQPLQLEVELTEDGNPVTGLPDGSVQAVLAGPNSGLGNVLSAADAKPASIDSNDTIAPAGLKAIAMRQTAEGAATLAEALGFDRTDTVTLTEAEPGIYRADFADTSAEGLYQVRYLVNGTAPGNGVFERQYTADHYVRVVADPAATVIETAVVEDCDAVGQCFRLTLTPRDGADNLLGPGKTALINVGDFSGEIRTPVTDNLNGSYSFEVAFPGRERTSPVVDVVGVEVPTPAVAGWTGAKSDIEILLRDLLGENWLYWIIAIALALLLLFFRLFGRRRTA